jgi:hypothetical protein
MENEMTSEQWQEYHSGVMELALEVCVALGVIKADDYSTYDRDDIDPLTAMLEDIKSRSEVFTEMQTACEAALKYEEDCGESAGSREIIEQLREVIAKAKGNDDEESEDDDD